MHFDVQRLFPVPVKKIVLILAGSKKIKVTASELLKSA